jgi:hypothetical protein
MKTFPLIILQAIILLSCTDNVEKTKLILQADEFMADGTKIISKYDTSFNTDSVYSVYKKIAKEDYLKGYNFADSIKLVANNLLAKHKNEDKELNEWYETEAGKISKQFPLWSRKDCERVAKKELWIGMEIDMVKVIYGSPQKVNISDYGRGKEYQYCWHNHSPSFFYTKEDGKVYSYN